MLRSCLPIALILALAPPAAADGALAFLPAAPTARVHYRIVRTQQTARNPAIAVTSFDLVRRTAKSLVLERTNPDGTPNDVPLTQGPDGGLTLGEDARGATGAELSDAVYALDLAIAATRGSDATATSTWIASIPLAAAAGAPAVTVTIEPGPSSPGAPGDVDFSGTGDAVAKLAPGGTGGMAVSVRVDGHATGGYVTRIEIVQTRAVTVAGLPFVNAGSWAIAVGK